MSRKGSRSCLSASFPLGTAHVSLWPGEIPRSIYRDDSARSDILAVDWSEDIRVTSSVCARKVTAS